MENGKRDFAMDEEVAALIERLVATIRQDLRQQTWTLILAGWSAVVTTALLAGAIAFAAARLV